MEPENINKDSTSQTTAEVEPTPFYQSANEVDGQTKGFSVMKKIVLIVLVLLSIPLMFFLWFAISFSGGIDKIVDDLKPKPDFNSTSISTQRVAAKAEIETAFTEMEEVVALKDYATATSDRCYKGEDDWKRDDGYAQRCEYRITKFYGFNDSFRQKLVVLEAELLALGWKASYGGSNTLTYYIENYYDEFAINKAPGSSSIFGDRHLVSDLPKVTNGYTKNGMGIDVAYIEKDTTNIDDLSSSQIGFGASGDTVFESKKLVDAQSIFEEITKDNRYVLAISIQNNYFQN